MGRGGLDGSRPTGADVVIPDPWVGVILAFGAFRLARLVGWDDLPPIQKLRNRLTGQVIRYMPTQSTEPVYAWKRPLLAHFLACPYCQGFWIALAVYLGWVANARVTLYALAPFALSAAVGIIARRLDP